MPKFKKFKCDILSNLQTMCPRIITKSTGSIFRQYLIFYGQNMKEIWHHLIFVMRCQDPLKCAASQNSSVTHCGKISSFVYILKFGPFKFSRTFWRFGIFNYIPALFFWENQNRKLRENSEVSKSAGSWNSTNVKI